MLHRSEDRVKEAAVRWLPAMPDTSDQAGDQAGIPIR